MTHGSLFSGIGGFDLAAEWMGWTNVFHCEWNPFGQKVLKHYWPDAELFTDITKSNFTKYGGTVDIISGGFPCQPYSAAGKRKGKEDERHLWPYMLDTIKSVRPRWVVGENVLGLVNWSDGLVFHEVQTDLEAAGYEVWPYVLPAASVGAPHRRDRVWFVAHAKLCSNRLPTTRRVDMERTILEGREWCQKADGFNIDNKDAADTNGDGFNQRNSKHEKQSGQRGVNALGHTNESNDNGNAADPEQPGFQGQHREWEGCSEHRVDEGVFIGSENKLNASDTMRTRGRKNNREGESKFFDENGKIGAWDIFPTQSPICGRDDGIPDRLDGITFPKWRNESIKAYGNAVCPQVVHQIFKAIEQYEILNP
jgi:DNA (cytosine-5)-methyltransferase 1